MTVPLSTEGRFDACEALNVLAHDYGLYALRARLDALPFRAGAGRATLAGLGEHARALYTAYEGWARGADPYAVPAEAARILDRIERGGVAW